MDNHNHFKIGDASLAYRKDRDAKWETKLERLILLDMDSQVRKQCHKFIASFTSETFIPASFC